MNSRRDPRLVELERMVASLRAQLDERRRAPGDLPFVGCGDNSCVIVTPSGMATNGGCRCEARELRFALQHFKRRIAFLEETVRELRVKRAETERDEALQVARFTSALPTK